METVPGRKRVLGAHLLCPHIPPFPFHGLGAKARGLQPHRVGVRIRSSPVAFECVKSQFLYLGKCLLSSSPYSCIFDYLMTVSLVSPSCAVGATLESPQATEEVNTLLISRGQNPVATSPVGPT